MENHVGAVWYFIHDYNAQQSKGLSRYPAILILRFHDIKTLAPRGVNNS
jgi:hypothetical protein